MGNTTSNLELQLRKLLPQEAADFHLSALRSFNEGVWFEPSNKNGENFCMCVFLAENKLIVRRITPIWLNGSFKGTRVAFMYNEDLNYQPEEIF